MSGESGKDQQSGGEHEHTEDSTPVVEPGETTTWSDSREDSHG